VPSADALQHERLAIEGLCEALTAAGRPSRVVAWPDRDPSAELTVDAIADLNGERWAIEHTRLTAPRTFPAAHKETMAALQTPLESIAQDAGYNVHLAVLPPVGSRSNRAEYFDSALRLAADGAGQGPGIYPMGDDAFTIAVVSSAGDRGTVASISAYSSDGGHPGLSGQLYRAMHLTWEHKLRHQLPPAKKAGFAVLLLLDGIPAPEQRVPPFWLADPMTVAEAIAQVLDANPAVVDEVWLRKLDGSYESIVPPADG
jgi:hypothetical protein